MILRYSTLALAALAGMSLSASGALASTSLGVDFPAGSLDFGPDIQNLGWSFTAEADVAVVGLGNLARTPFPQDQQVGLWNSSGTLLASAFVSNSSSAVGSAPWLFSAITPVRLVAGQTYVVGGQGGADYTGLIAGATFDPRISFGGDRFSFLTGANSPLIEPTLTEGLGPNEASWFGGNIELSAVPEPSTWAMMLLGFAGLGYAGYRRARVAEAA
jgi:Domain of unknown function (DUF4082)/PEP-CTERM motif